MGLLLEASLFEGFESPSGRWIWRKDNYASYEVLNSVARLCSGPSEALYYSNAELSDGVFDDLPWACCASVEFRARMTGSHFGSAGWGFWNHSMRVKQSFPIWFIYLMARGKYPLQGFFAQLGDVFYPIKLFQPVTIYKLGLTLLPFLAPIKIASSRPSMQELDLEEWHEYKVSWHSKGARFFIDGVEVAAMEHDKAGEQRQRLDVWIDNSVFYPFRGDAGGVYRHVTQENRVRTCIEVDFIKLAPSSLE
ncbi:MAG: family 16 glycosylhydrolase [Zestosphaera sp.]